MKGEVKIETRHETARGCGFRKPGGLYLTAKGMSRECGKFPIPLDVCPCCGGGIKPSRGWTWINGTQLAAGRPCRLDDGRWCDKCPMDLEPGRVGLIWIGGSFYPTPADFTREAATQGVSRRIAAIPKDFELGRTWVWVAHRQAIDNPDGSQSAGIFHAFKPAAIEYVVRPDDPRDKLERLAARSVTLVDVKPVRDKSGQGLLEGSAPA